MKPITLILLSACATSSLEDKDPADLFQENDRNIGADPDPEDDRDEDDDEDNDEDSSNDDDDGPDDSDDDGPGPSDDDDDDDDDDTPDSDPDDDDDSPDSDSDDDPGTIDEEEDTTPIPGELADDCTEGLNDDLDSADILETDETHIVYEGLTLCNEYDVYTLDVPPETWVSVSIEIDGSGAGSTDIDLYEVAHPDFPLESGMDFVTTETGSLDILTYSSSEEDYERLAWYNPGSSPRTHALYVAPYSGEDTEYTIRVRTSSWHQVRDCDDVYSDTSESGPCNRVMHVPNAVERDQGYLVTHQAHYSHLRREVAYLVTHAAAEVQEAFPGTAPLALMDMSETDGDTPGRMVDSLRHPEGTHVNGNDIDIAYYQTGSDNMGREVCESDGYFCTGPATLLEPRRTAYYMALLMRSPYIRVIGVDPVIAEDVLDAADDLRSEGMLSSSDISNLDTYMAYGDGWPFHHHHMHFSWQWESGYEMVSLTPDAGVDLDGCAFALEDDLPLKPLPPL